MPTGQIVRPKQHEADQRKEDIEHLFNGQRPEHSPAGRQPGIARCFEPVEMKGEGGKQRAREGEEFFVDDVAFNTQQMQRAQDGEHEQQQRHDAREADAVEGARPDGIQRAEAAQRGERDQEAGDGEEGRDAVAAVEEDEVACVLRPVPAEPHVDAVKANEDVQQDDREDREPAQDIDPIEPRHSGLAVAFVEH